MKNDETQILVLCAGESVRFDGPGLKQLLTVEGIPVLHRMTRMVLDRGFENVVIVTHRPALCVNGCGCFDPGEQCRWTCETLLSTAGTWSPYARIVVLLGDVYYTDEALDRVLYVEKDFCVYSDTQDIFATVFSNHVYATLADILVGMIEHADAENQSPHNQGRLWELYRAWHRLPDHSAVPIESTRGVTFEPICDRTQDFDTLADYVDFTHGVSKNVLLCGSGGSIGG